ncbi:MAG: hypothetical protein HYY52_07820 [Candidatus Melainabacteria bacterium]|nr:hypothetical protein [Candidatus Melainabacteria bacterium]
MKLVFLLVSFLLFVLATPLLQAHAYSEFYEYSLKTSGRNINCALCHTNSDGPDGNGPGQIGSLNKEELKKLMEARTAFEPHQKVNSPILNEFGNKLIYILGKKGFVKLKSHPENLAKEIGNELDIDNDGIPDSEEYLDGTLATSKEDGHPVKLFIANIKKNLYHIILAFFSIGLLFYGFAQWLIGVHNQAILDELGEDIKE